MARFVLTPAAARDLDRIADHTIERFGVHQARRYRDGLRATFELIAEHPLMGRDSAHIKAGCRRHAHAGHVIYYRLDGKRVVVLRVLHAAQDPLRHLGED